MTATIGSVAISRCTLRTPRYGAASADFDLIDDTVLAIGSLATLTVGDDSRVGTVRPGSDFGGQAAYSWIAGAGGWENAVAAQPYHDDAGIHLLAVATDLAAAAGEIGMVVPMDRVLGQDWTRPAAVARDLLDALTRNASGVGEWWLGADGVTHLGPRPSSGYASSTLTVASYNPELRHAVVQVADDAIAGLTPGATLTAPGLPSLLIGSTVVHVTDDAIEVEIFGERTGAELFAAMVNAVTAWRTFLQQNPYTVQSVATDGRVAVKAADAGDAAFPDAPLLTHAPGLPGATVALAPGAPVVVSYLEGDPGKPVVTSYPTSTVLPVRVALAATEIDLTGIVRLGGNGGGPVMLDPFGAFTTWLTAVGAATGAGPPPGGITATKVFGV